MIKSTVEYLQIKIYTVKQIHSMKPKPPFLLILALILLNTCLHATEATTKAQMLLPDSLLTEDHVYEYTFTNFPLACRIMDQLRERNLLPPHQLDITEGDLYFNNGYYHRALKVYRRALDSDSVRLNDTEYMEQLHRMISTYDCLHNDVKKTKYVRLLLDKAQACGNHPMHSIALFNMGKMLYYQGNRERGYEYIQKAIYEMSQTDYKYKYDNLRYNYNTLLVMQQRDRKYAEALETLDALEAVVTEAQGNEPHMQGLDRKELKALYANRAVVLGRLGRTTEAEDFYRKFFAMGNIHDRDNYLIMPYLSDRRMYDEIIRMNTAREQFLCQQGDTVTYHMMTIKRSLGEAYENKGDYRHAAAYFKQLAMLCDSIKNREQRSAALELAAVYETNEKEALLQYQTSELRERNILLVAAAGIVLLLAAWLVLIARHYRTIRRKNRAMARNINEQMDYKKKLLEIKQENLALRQQIQQTEEEPTDEVTDTSDEDTTEQRQTATAALSPDITNDTESETEKKMSSKELENLKIFDRLELLLDQHKPYLDRNFSRDDLSKLACVGRNSINPLITACTGMNVNTYINSLRLEFAVSLIEQHPNYTISSIAEESGLPNMATFHRLFREKYSMTPAEFRKSLE